MPHLPGRRISLMCGNESLRGDPIGSEIYSLLHVTGILTILEKRPGDAIRLTAPGIMDLCVDYLQDGDTGIIPNLPGS